MTCDKNNNFKLFILKEKVLFTAAFEIPLHCALSREKERQNNTSDLWLWRQTLFDSFRRVRLTFLTWLFPLHVGWEARPINTPTAHACRSDFNCWCIPGRLNLLSYFDFLAKTSPGLVFFFSLVTSLIPWAHDMKLLPTNVFLFPMQQLAAREWVCPVITGALQYIALFSSHSFSSTVCLVEICCQHWPFSTLSHSLQLKGEKGRIVTTERFHSSNSFNAVAFCFHICLFVFFPFFYRSSRLSACKMCDTLYLLIRITAGYNYQIHLCMIEALSRCFHFVSFVS